METKFSIIGQTHTIHIKRIGNAVQFARSQNELTEKVGCPVIEKERFFFDSADTLWEFLQTSQE